MSYSEPVSSDSPFGAPLANEPILAAELAPPPPAKPRVWPVFVSLLVVIVAIIISQVVFVVPIVVWHLQSGVRPDELAAKLIETLSQPAAFIGLAALSQLAMGGTALVAAWLSPVTLTKRLGFIPSSWTLGDTIIVLIGGIIPLAIGIASAYALATAIDPDPSVKKLYENMTLAWSVPFVLFIALAPGFCEEMLFRGYMQRRLLERFGPPIALTITAIIFGLFHVTPHAIAAAFPIGVWLGLMAWRSGSIWPGIVCHALVNGLWNIRTMLIKFEIIPERPPLALLTLLLLVGVAAFVWSLRILFRTPTDTPATAALRAP